MESSPSVCKDPQAEWVTENETDSEIPRPAVAETQKEWTERGSEGDA